MPRKRAKLSARAENSEKYVFGAYMAASLTMVMPASAIVSFDAAVTLTGSL